MKCRYYYCHYDTQVSEGRCILFTSIHNQYTKWQIRIVAIVPFFPSPLPKNNTSHVLLPLLLPLQLQAPFSGNSYSIDPISSLREGVLYGQPCHHIASLLIFMLWREVEPTMRTTLMSCFKICKTPFQNHRQRCCYWCLFNTV